MSIAAANLWTRNIYKEYLRRDATPTQEAKQAKLASLVVKFGAVLFIVFIDPQFSIDLQLIGGVIILQTLPAVAIALYTRWLHRWALIAGWAVGMAWGLYLLYLIPNPATGTAHFGGSALHARQAVDLRLAPVRRLARCRSTSGSWRWPANLVVAVAGHRRPAEAGVRTVPTCHGADYHADEGDPHLREIAVH